MAGNPLVAQGSLNRLRASVLWDGFPSLNVTSPFLGKSGIRLALEGEITQYIDTMTGAVTSPEPYQRARLTLAVLKTNGLGNAYKVQMELNSLLGNGSVRPDTVALGVYPLINCSIMSVGEQAFDGSEAIFPVVCMGYYNVNSNLWNLTT